MNTLLFTLEYPPFHGGVANYYGNLVKYWPEPGKIFVLDNNNGRLLNNRWPFLKWLPAIRALNKTVRNNTINHIIIGNILPLGTACLIFHQFSKIKYSVILHGMDFSFALKVRRKKMMAKKILTSAEKIICTNAYTSELVKKFLGMAPPGKIATVNPGIDEKLNILPPSKQLMEKYQLDNKIILLSVGRLVRRKGFDRVVDCLPKVLKPAPSLVYVILGEGEGQENLKLKILNLKLQNNVFIINNASDEERDGWYNLCDIFIMPSRNLNGDFEGFGIVYLEANLAGKPVIAGRSGGVGDAVIDGLNGLMVNPESIDEISGAIIKLALNSELRSKLGEQGRQRAINDFNCKKQVQKIYNFLR